LYRHFVPPHQIPYYYDQVNAAWSGLWTGILYTTVLLVVLDYTAEKYAEGPVQEAYRSKITWVRKQLMLFCCCMAVCLDVLDY
jgi:hypothetical protein